LIVVGAMGALWAPLLACLPLAALAAAATVAQAVRSACRAPYAASPRHERLKLRAISAVLHIIQPAARLCGRLRYGLTPWRRKSPRPFALPLPRTISVWSERWQAAEERLKAIETILQEARLRLRRGGIYDAWDLEIRGGLFACVRTRMAIEEYPRGRQYLRFRAWPCFGTYACALAALPVAGLAIWASLRHEPLAAALMACLTVLFLLRAVGDGNSAMACLVAALQRYAREIEEASSSQATAPVAQRPDDSQAASVPDTPLPASAPCEVVVNAPIRRPQSHRGDDSSRQLEVGAESTKAAVARLGQTLTTGGHSS